MDIDHFKQINDNYGHPFGDYVLKTLGNVMDSVLRSPCKLFRYGGEEFVTIMPETRHAKTVTTIERLMVAVKEHHFQCDESKLRKLPSAWERPSTQNIQPRKVNSLSWQTRHSTKPRGLGATGM